MGYRNAVIGAEFNKSRIALRGGLNCSTKVGRFTSGYGINQVMPRNGAGHWSAIYIELDHGSPLKVKSDKRAENRAKNARAQDV